MPWSEKDVEKHMKDLSPKQKEVWVKVANGALARCKEKGQDDCEARAIKQANAVAGRMGESFDEWYESLDEDTLALIEGHIHGLKTALDKERKMRKNIQKTLKDAETWSEDIKNLLKGALNEEDPAKSPQTYRYWIKDVSVDDTFFVYEDQEDGKTYKRSYVVADNGALTMGARAEVRVVSTYQVIGESTGQDIVGDAIPLREKAVAGDGTVLVKIIQPGWGTSGYYSDKVLERDAPKVFTKGLQMYWDHPTETEERERPERSLRDLAGELVEDARYMPDGAWGPGPYARAKVFGGFGATLNELAPHIGVSINGRGLAEYGEAEGKEGPIIQEISSVRSVDFVTVPGAGGKILELFESARSRPEKENEKMEKELKEAQDALAKTEAEKAEALAEIARFKEAAVLAKAKDVASEALAKQDIPEMTKARLGESIAKNPPVKDGELDEEVFKAAIEAAVAVEVAYIAELAGAGAIRGMGAKPAGSEGDKAGLKDSWIALYRNKGETLETATLLAERAMEG